MRSKKMDSMEPLALLMAEWRTTAIDIVKAHVKDESEIALIESIVLDMIAVEATHEDATSQVGERGLYTLAHTKQVNDGRTNAKWYNAGLKATQQLQIIDDKHGMGNELVDHFEKVPVFFRTDPSAPQALCRTHCH